MIRIRSNPQKKPAQDVTFESPATLKQNGVEMLIAVNMTPKMVVTGPEVGIDAKIIVTKEKPHFFFNPKVLQFGIKDSTIVISYTTYQGESQEITLTDECGAIRQAIDHLHNGIERANKRKV